MLKQTLRRALRSVNRWSAADHPRTGATAASAREFSYDWLNKQLFPRVQSQPGAKLRPSYTWGVMQGLSLARALNIKRVSVLEFGVAGGRGLLALEQVAQALEPTFGVQVDVYGFDTGMGLPKPSDNRDLPNIHRTRQISPIYGLRYVLPMPYSGQVWTEMFFMAHLMDHSRYADI